MTTLQVKPGYNTLGSFYASLAQTFQYLGERGFKEFQDYGTNHSDGLRFYFNHNAVACLDKNKPLSWYHLSLHPFASMKIKKHDSGEVWKEILLNIEDLEIEDAV